MYTHVAIVATAIISVTTKLIINYCAWSIIIACENAEYARISSEGTQLSRKSAFKSNGRDTTESSLLANSDTSRSSPWLYR